MSYAMLAGLAVTEATIRFPLVGTWEAQATVTGDSAAKLSGRLELTVGTATLSGTVLRAEADAGGLVTVRLVGGAGGLATSLAPKAYRSATRRVILRDALEAGGETISGASDADWLDASVERWTRPQTTTGEAVKAVLAGTGYSWRISTDGAVVFGRDSWPEVSPKHVVESEDPTRDELVIALEQFDVLPGSTFAGRRVSSATYQLDASKLRASIGYDPDGRAGPAAELGRFIQRELASVAMYRPLAARVLAQAGDGTLDVRMLDSSMPDLQRVPVKFGIRGIAANGIPAGSECYIVHENGDPRRPVVVGFAPGTAGTIEIDASEILAGGSQSLALASPLLSWATSVQSALQGLGAPIAPLSGVETTTLKGA